MQKTKRLNAFWCVRSLFFAYSKRTAFSDLRSLLFFCVKNAVFSRKCDPCVDHVCVGLKFQSYKCSAVWHSCHLLCSINIRLVERTLWVRDQNIRNVSKELRSHHCCMKFDRDLKSWKSWKKQWTRRVPRTDFRCCHRSSIQLSLTTLAAASRPSSPPQKKCKPNMTCWQWVVI